jgi:hypothetical protein
MTKVFIGGSRRISRLNSAIKSRADSIMQNNYLVLIGDANGADKSIQTYLANKSYKNVLVFCAGSRCRNNVGSWETRHVTPKRETKDFSFYAAKDLEMAKEADYGFMIWDAESKGTLHNMLSLLRNQKKVLVYFSPEKTFFTLKGIDDIRLILEKCDQKVVELFENEIKKARGADNKQQALNLG